MFFFIIIIGVNVSNKNMQQIFTSLALYKLHAYTVIDNANSNRVSKSLLMHRDPLDSRWVCVHVGLEIRKWRNWDTSEITFLLHTSKHYLFNLWVNISLHFLNRDVEKLT